MDKSKLYFWFIMIFVLCCGSVLYGENLVINGDFEESYLNAPIHWTKDAWQSSESVTKYYIETDNPHSGEKYVTIENVQNNDARLTQDVRVKPFTYYKLSSWVKAVNCNKQRTGANLSVMHPNLLETSKDIKDTGGNWEYMEYYVRTGPKQENLTVAIRLGGFGSDTTGKVSFDDFKLEEVTNPRGIDAVDIVKDDGIAAEESKSETSVFIIIIAIITLTVIVGMLIYIFVIKPGLKVKDEPTVLVQRQEQGKGGKINYSWKDLALAGALTLVYAIVALTNLGSCEAPQTYWKPSSRGENVIVDFGQEKEVRRIYYFQGLPGGHGPDAKYEVDYSDDKENWTHVASLGPDTIHYWYYKSTNIKARYMRITVEKPRSWLNEVVFVGEDITKPIEIKKIESGSGINPMSKGKIENLFDEQDIFSRTGGSRPSHTTGMSPGFDEQYHARTALEHIVLDDPYEDTHPPLGKLLIALGILIFGMTPFGWRFMGTFFGILMIPIMYAFGKELFKKKEYAFLSALLLAVDFMHFTQSRIATIDTYGVFFIILMYFFMFKHYKISFYTTEFKKTLLPLLFSGICFGLGCASKWTVAMGVFGLVVLGVISLVKKAVENIEMKKRLSSKELKKDKKEWNRIKYITGRFPRYIIATLLIGVLVFFIIVPSILYFLSYVPLWFVPEISKSPRNPTIFHWVLESQTGMLNYHSEVTQEHSFSSKWWQWPLMTRPMWYHVAHGLPADQTQRLFAFGNPAIWWLGSIAAIVVIIIAIGGFLRRVGKNFKDAPKNMRVTTIIYYIMKDDYEKDDARFAILIALAAQFLPWVIAPRKLTFIYHFFPSVPFIILCLVYLVKLAKEYLIPYLEKKKTTFYRVCAIGTQGIILVYFLAALVLFIMFYPILAGIPFDANYIRKFLKWFPTWYFA